MDIWRYFIGALVVIALAAAMRILQGRLLRAAAHEDRLHFVVRAPMWRLAVCDDDLTLTPMLGRAARWTVSEITHLTANVRGIGIWAGEKRLFTVHREAIGCKRLVSYMIEKGVRTPSKIDLQWRDGGL